MLHETQPNSKHYLACERKGIFELLIVSAGMMGAYTYNLRGGVFCNAQTANLLLMAISFGKMQWHAGFYYLIPMTAYILGGFVSELLPNPVKKWRLLRWDTYLIGFEMLVLFIIGFIPLTAPHRIVQVTINFICSMQYNTFRQAEGIPMATTFCTNHVRQVGTSLAHFLKHHDIALLKRCLSHILMLIGFLIGGIVMTALSNKLQARAIWLALIPMGIAFIQLAYADIVSEHDYLDDKPSGH